MLVASLVTYYKIVNVKAVEKLNIKMYKIDY